MSKTDGSYRSKDRHFGVRDLVPALLITASAVLVADHWMHFETPDFLILGVIVASSIAHVFTIAKCSVERRKVLSPPSATTINNSTTKSKGRVL